MLEAWHLSMHGILWNPMNLGVKNAAVTTCMSAVKALKGTDQRQKQCNQKTNSLEWLTRQLKAIPEGYLWLYLLRLPLANFLRECCSRDWRRSMHHSKWSHAHTPRENIEFGSASPCQPIAPKRIPPWEMDKGGSMTWANHQENDLNEKCISPNCKAASTCTLHIETVSIMKLLPNDVNPVPDDFCTSTCIFKSTI